MNELRATMGIFANQCYQIIRTEGFYSDGIYRRTKTETAWGKGDVQPASNTEIERLPEGMRADGAITIFTVDQLKTASSPNTVPDRLMIQGVEYEVGAGDYWPSYNRYVCAKVGQ